MGNINILFAGHDLKFATNIINYFELREGFDVKEDVWKGHTGHDEEESLKYLHWADVIVCEWGLGNAVWYSQNKLSHQKLIVRMHLQEVDTPYPKRFNLSNIDKIIAISPYVYEEFYRVFKFPRQKMTMIYNVIDTKKFDRVKDKPKFNLGFVGMSPKRKRLDLAVDILEKLWNEDSRYTLYIKGKRPEEYPWLWRKEEERLYYTSLYERIEKAPWKDSVIFDGFGSDIPEWFTKIGFILSTSDFESFHLSPSEGMASGTYPIILNWDGSNTIYPEKYLMTSVEESVERIKNVSYDQQTMQELKKYVNDNFSIEKIGLEWEKLIVSL
ncbi:glycosyltransferase family 4 protein [Sediminibacillus terrae]|uniref:glycosyltransferase family 4 protein n=1 Tax=Sediminibacillus terrae TaxID=1562106 RepID=UPI001294E94B|nr:glycosyltransferase family 4 protein [Sediminibacillus terrae]